MDLLNVNRFEVSQYDLLRTIEALREYGGVQRERFVFWAGQVVGAKAIVTELILPAQSSYNQGGFCWVDIPAEETRRIMIECSVKGLVLFAQIHSHPSRAYHSKRDDDLAVLRLPGSVSIVVPNFASEPFTTVTRYACYRLSPTGKWESVPTQISDQVVVVS